MGTTDGMASKYGISKPRVFRNCHGLSTRNGTLVKYAWSTWSGVGIAWTRVPNPDVMPDLMESLVGWLEFKGLLIIDYSKRQCSNGVQKHEFQSFCNADEQGKRNIPRVQYCLGHLRMVRRKTELGDQSTENRAKRERTHPNGIN